MRLERCHHCVRQHCGPVLRAFAVANDDLRVVEVDILDPQAKGLHQPKAASVQQLNDQQVAPIHVVQQAFHFLDGKHYRQARRSPGTNDVVEPGGD